MRPATSPATAAARGHRSVEHTADVGLEAWGATLAEAYEEVAVGLFELMLDLATVWPRIERRIAVTADDPRDLVVRWLTELLYLVDSEGLVFRRFVVQRVGERELVATGYGEPLDLSRHDGRTAVKAATYHDLLVEAGPPARIGVLLDL
jgi:SHS2 domain-containing protein